MKWLHSIHNISSPCSIAPCRIGAGWHSYPPNVSPIQADPISIIGKTSLYSASYPRFLFENLCHGFRESRTSRRRIGPRTRYLGMRCARTRPTEQGKGHRPQKGGRRCEICRKPAVVAVVAVLVGSLVGGVPQALALHPPSQDEVIWADDCELFFMMLFGLDAAPAYPKQMSVPDGGTVLCIPPPQTSPLWHDTAGSRLRPPSAFPAPGRGRRRRIPRRSAGPRRKPSRSPDGTVCPGQTNRRARFRSPRRSRQGIAR